MKTSTLNLLLFFILCSPILKAQAPPTPYGAVPSKSQLAWHNIELYGLVHFTPTTFENKEWGYGDADPKIFNPTSFDAEQIVKAAKAGGLKGIILVAKHHDGFALWPTQTTNYNISQSPYQNGKADLVKDFENAARKNGLQFGIYCSPWDRNNAYYGTSKYLSIYQAQLKELYTHYGPLFISWHDGANGGDGYYGGAKEKRTIDNTTYYDWENTWGLTRRLQPTANIFSDIGPDIRWVGNEKGTAAETSWGTFTPMPPEGKNVAVPGQANYPQSPMGIRNGKFWIPAECDVPLRKGWFYHPNEKPKTPEQLFDLYLKSVGRGAALDLGLAPDTRGMLHEDDVEALAAFGLILTNTFSNNLAHGAAISATHFRGKKYRPQLLIDGNKNTYWATNDNIKQASITLSFSQVITFDLISLQEFIALGQRIEAYHIEAFIDNHWQKIAEGESIGAKKLIRVAAPIHTKKVRLSITKSPAAITLSEIGLYLKAD
jgi:alpha-L-fucosidase